MYLREEADDRNAESESDGNFENEKAYFTDSIENNLIKVLSNSQFLNFICYLVFRF